MQDARTILNADTERMLLEALAGEEDALNTAETNLALWQKKFEQHRDIVSRYKAALEILTKEPE